MCLNEPILKMWDLASPKSAEETTRLGIFRDNVANTVERQQYAPMASSYGTSVVCQMRFRRLYKSHLHYGG